MSVSAIVSNYQNSSLCERDHVNGLSLVANGTDCLFLTEFLAQLESKTKAQTRHLFDVIAGTSSGGLVAAALNQGVPAAEIGVAFASYASKIYRKHPFPLSLTGNWIKSSYNQRALRKLVVLLVGKDQAQLTLEQVNGGLLLPMWDLHSHTQYDLVSESLLTDQTDFSASGQVTLEDAVVASMATPAQFAPVKLDGKELIDASAIISPITCISSALENIGVDVSVLDVLSLRAAHPIYTPANVGHSENRNSIYFPQMNNQKAVLSSMLELVASRAAVSARNRFGERFQEFRLELTDPDKFQSESYKKVYLESIKQAARNEFQRFSSDDNLDRFHQLFT